MSLARSGELRTKGNGTASRGARVSETFAAVAKKFLADHVSGHDRGGSQRILFIPAGVKGGIDFHMGRIHDRV